jgi:hypothetical protein
MPTCSFSIVVERDATVNANVSLVLSLSDSLVWASSSRAKSEWKSLGKQHRTLMEHIHVERHVPISKLLDISQKVVGGYVFSLNLNNMSILSNIHNTGQATRPSKS